MASRRNRHVVRESKKQLYLTLGGIILVVFFLLFFAGSIIEFIGNATFLFRGETTNDQSEEQSSIILPPSLDPIPDSTSETNVTISGSVIENEGEIEIYLNGEMVSSVSIEDDGEFSQDVQLVEGENTIRVRHVIGDEKSDYSSARVTYTNDPPQLEIESPSNGVSFSQGDQRIEVRGTSDAGTDVTVNGFRAVSSADGSFSYFLQLAEGENKITVEAVNEAGLSTSQEITVTYSP